MQKTHNHKTDVLFALQTGQTMQVPIGLPVHNANVGFVVFVMKQAQIPITAAQTARKRISTVTTPLKTDLIIPKNNYLAVKNVNTV